SHDVVTAACRVRYQIAIKQDHWYACLIENFGDLAVDGVLLGGELQWSKEHPGYLPGHQLAARLGSLLLQILRVRKRAAPQQNMMAPVLSFGHAATDRFKDFCPPQLRDQQTERVAASHGVGTHIAA